MNALNRLWPRLSAWAEQIRNDERGDSLINWDHVEAMFAAATK